MVPRSALVAAVLLLAFTACGERQPDLRPGETARGALEEGDPVVRGSYQDRWRFDLGAGDRVRIELRADSFDAYLALMRRGESLATNDDALGRDAALTYRAQAAGRYTALVRSVGDRPAHGSYALALERLADSVASPGEAVTLAVGASTMSVLEIAGVLETGDALTGTLSPWSRRGLVDYIEFRANRSALVDVTLTSPHFDAFLGMAGIAATEARVEQMFGNDDGAGGRNAKLTYRVEAGRRYRIAAASYFADAGSGLYRLSLTVRPESWEQLSWEWVDERFLTLPSEAARLCRGKAIPYAAPYDSTSDVLHPTVADAADTQGWTLDDQSRLNFVMHEWRPDDPKRLELVLCLLHTKTVLQWCPYWNPALNMSSISNRVRHQWVGQLREARTARLVAETGRLQGDVPPACPRRATVELSQIGLGNLHGSLSHPSDAADAMRPQLAHWVDPSGGRANRPAIRR